MVYGIFQQHGADSSSQLSSSYQSLLFSACNIKQIMSPSPSLMDKAGQEAGQNRYSSPVASVPILRRSSFEDLNRFPFLEAFLDQLHQPSVVISQQAVVIP
jgi:hypothetical protein